MRGAVHCRIRQPGGQDATLHMPYIFSAVNRTWLRGRRASVACQREGHGAFTRPLTANIVRASQPMMERVP